MLFGKFFQIFPGWLHNALASRLLGAGLEVVPFCGDAARVVRMATLFTKRPGLLRGEHHPVGLSVGNIKRNSLGP
jgi:hypothetical protein